MRSLGKGLRLAAVLALCLLAAGCGAARADAGDPEDAVPVTVLDYAAFPDLGGVETVSMSAGFLTEDGEAIQGGRSASAWGRPARTLPWTAPGSCGCPACPRRGPWR